MRDACVLSTQIFMGLAPGRDDPNFLNALFIVKSIQDRILLREE